jgi:hypothetical protein
MNAWRSRGRHRVRQRSSRVDILFLLAVASLYRLRHRSSRVAVASRRLLRAAAAIHFSAVLRLLRVFYLPKIEAYRWLFLMGSAVPYLTAGYTLTISNSTWSAIGKGWGFGRFFRDIMRHIHHEKLKDFAVQTRAWFNLLKRLLTCLNHLLKGSGCHWTTKTTTTNYPSTCLGQYLEVGLFIYRIKYFTELY